MTDLACVGAIKARCLIGSKAPSLVELVEACFAQVEALDHAVHALIAGDSDRVLGNAREAEKAMMAGNQLGALRGLPFAVKDTLDVSGRSRSENKVNLEIPVGRRRVIRLGSRTIGGTHILSFQFCCERPFNNGSAKTSPR